jgi:hypothetical protein
MDTKDIRNLVESYQNVYAEQEVSEDMYSTVKAGLEKGSKALQNSPAGGVLKMLVGPVGGNKGKRTPSAADQKKKIAANESVELYNIVFNHLIEEGFASSEENAEKIISVMSDEWISSIVEQQETSARADYLQGKFDRENAAKSGSALTAIPGKQNTGQALQKARQSAAAMAKGV